MLWSGRRDLNPRPLAPQASALPGCATPRTIQVSLAGIDLFRIAKNLQHLVDLVLHAPDYLDCVARRPSFLYACPCMPPTLQTLQREPLLVPHPFDLEEHLDVLRGVLPLPAPGLLGTQEPEFRFPEPQDIRRKASQPAHLPDLVEELLADCGACAVVRC